MAKKNKWQKLTAKYLNPLNWGVSSIDAANFNEAFEKAKRAGYKEFLYEGVRYTTEYAGSVKEETSLYGTQKEKEIIVNKNEKPINIFIYDFSLNGTYGYTSHAALEYNGEWVSFGGSGFGALEAQATDTNLKCYQIYPSMLKDFNIDPQTLTKAIKSVKSSVKGNDYNYFTNNCCDQVIKVLEAAGAKNISQPLGVAVPNILEDWAKKYGKQINPKQSVFYKNPYLNDTNLCSSCIVSLDYIADPEKYRQFATNVLDNMSSNGIQGILKQTLSQADIRQAKLTIKSNYNDYRNHPEKTIKKIIEALKQHRNDPVFTEKIYSKMISLPDKTKELLIKNGINEELKQSLYYRNHKNSVLVRTSNSSSEQSSKKLIAQNTSSR